MSDSIAIGHTGHIAYRTAHSLRSQPGLYRRFVVAQHESNTTLSTKSIIAHKLNLYTSLAERRFCVPRAPPLRSTPRRRPRRVARRVRVPRGLKRRRLKALEQRVARHRNELSSDASLAHSKRGRWWNVHRPPHLMLEVRLRHEADACEAVPRVEPPSGGDTRFKQARPLSTYKAKATSQPRGRFRCHLSCFEPRKATQRGAGSNRAVLTRVSTRAAHPSP